MKRLSAALASGLLIALFQGGPASPPDNQTAVRGVPARARIVVLA